MKNILVITCFLFCFQPAQALAETRLGLGAGWAFCDKTECNEERSGNDLSPDTVQWQLEQRFTRDLYIQARAEMNWWMYGSYGLHLKYVFPSGYVQNQHTGFYLRGGIHRYDVDLEKFSFSWETREKEKYSGTSYSMGVGWQRYTESSWGLAGELFYTDLDRYQSYGATLTLSYRFGGSRF